MWRKTANVVNGRRKALYYGCAAIALAAYGLPRIPRLQHGLPGTFSFLWIATITLVLAANIYFLVGADKERSMMLEVRQILPSRIKQRKDIQESPKRVRSRG